MNVLFLCSTPLQCLIAEAIIARNGHLPGDCSLFYFSWVRNEKVEHYYRRLADRCSEAVFHRCDTGYPGNLLGTRRYFRGRHFDRVYCACTNNAYVQMALSVAGVGEIETFDDGTANLHEGGAYAQRYGMGLARYLSAWLLGNRMPQYRIRALARRHYTVFREARNVAEAPLEFVDIFPLPETAPPEGECTLILGTVLVDALATGREDVASRLQAFAAGLEGEVIYLPHPRGEALPGLEKYVLHSAQIAEDVVAGLLSRHARVTVYGFASSSQFVFAACSRVRNICFDVPELAPAMRDLTTRGVQEFGMSRQPL